MDGTPKAKSLPAVQLYRYTALARSFEDAIAEQGDALPSMFVDALRESFDRCATAIMTSRVDARDAAVRVEGKLQAYQHGDPTRWDFTMRDVTVRFPGSDGRTLVLDGLKVTSVDLALAGRPGDGGATRKRQATKGSRRKRTRAAGGTSRQATKPIATAAAAAAAGAGEKGEGKRCRKS